jgi:flagellar basal body-associated protein FliL
MEFFELMILIIFIAVMLIIAGLVGLSLWLSNNRAVEQLKQDNLNYRRELISGSGGSPSTEGGEPDMMTGIMQFVQQNPQQVQQILQALNIGQKPPEN